MFTDQGGGVLTQPRQVLVCRRQHRVPPRFVETLHRGDVSEESLVTPGLQQFVCDHLAQGRGVQNTHLQILKGQYHVLGSDRISRSCSGCLSISLSILN